MRKYNDADTIDRLVREHKPLVAYVLHGVARKLRGFYDPDAAYSDGLWSLLRAARNYKAHLGFKFSTYAYGAIFKCVAHHEIRRRIVAARTVSWSPVFDDSVEDLPHRDRCEAQRRRRDSRETIHALLADDRCRLNEPERFIVTQFYCCDDPPLQADVARAMRLSKQRISQIKIAAIEKLRVQAGTSRVYRRTGTKKKRPDRQAVGDAA